jgi:hypothetical protein
MTPLNMTVDYLANHAELADELAGFSWNEWPSIYLAQRANFCRWARCGIGPDAARGRGSEAIEVARALSLDVVGGSALSEARLAAGRAN